MPSNFGDDPNDIPISRKMRIKREAGSNFLEGRRAQMNEALNQQRQATREWLSQPSPLDEPGFIPLSAPSKLDSILQEHDAAIQGHSNMSFRGSAPQTPFSGGSTSGPSNPLENMKSRFRREKISFTEGTTMLGAGEQSMQVNALFTEQTSRGRVSRTGYYYDPSGTQMLFNPESLMSSIPVLPRIARNQQGEVYETSALDRTIEAYRSGPVRSVISNQNARAFGNQGAMNIPISNQVAQSGIGQMLSQSYLIPKGQGRDEFVNFLNESRSPENPLLQSQHGPAIPAQAYMGYRASTLIKNEHGDSVWASALDKFKRLKLEKGDVDRLLSRSDTYSFNEDPGYFEGQLAPNKGYDVNVLFNAFSPLPEGQSISSNLFAARSKRGTYTLPEGTAYHRDDGSFVLPDGRVLQSGGYFGRKLGTLNAGNERLGGRSDFRDIFGIGMGSYASVSVDKLNPILNSQGEFTGEVGALLTQVTPDFSTKYGATKNFNRRVNKAGMMLPEADIEMRLPGASALPRLGWQHLQAEYPTQEALGGWFRELASAQGRSEEWINQNYSNGRFSSEASPMVLQAGVENLLNKFSGFRLPGTQRLDMQTYTALRNASFQDEGGKRQVIPDYEGNVIPRYDDQGTQIGADVKEMWGYGGLTKISTNVRAEFNRSRMSISPSVLNVLSQYEPQQFQSLMEIADKTRGQNRSLNLVQAYRANQSEKQATALQSTFGVGNISQEQIATMQGELIAANPSISGDALSEQILRRLKDQYGNHALGLDIGGETTYLPSAAAALGSITRTKGQNINNWGMKQAALLQAYGGGDSEAITSARTSLMGDLEKQANSSSTLRKALSIELPRSGGLGLAISGVDPDTLMVSGKYMAKAMGSDVDTIRRMAAEGSLTPFLTRDPFSKINEYGAQMRTTLYEDQPESFRSRNPDPGANFYMNPIAGSAAQGDFDADRYKAIWNAVKSGTGMFVTGLASRIVPNSEMIRRAKDKFESEWTKNVEDVAERTSQYGDIEGLKKSFSDPRKLFPMLASEIGQAFFKDQKGGSKGVGTTYNTFLRNAFGAANITAQEAFSDNSFLSGSESSLYHRAAQGILDTSTHDPQLDYLRDILSKGFMGKDTYGYMKDGKRQDLGDASTFSRRVFESVTQIGASVGDAEYEATGLRRGVATSLIGMEELATNPNPEALIGQMENLLMQKRGGADVSNQMLSLAGASNPIEWLFGKSGAGASSLSLIAHSVAGRMGEWAARKGRTNIPQSFQEAGQSFARAKAYKEQVERASQGVEAVANATGGSPTMNQYVQGLLPRDEGISPVAEVSQMVNEVVPMTDVGFSNTINSDLGLTPASGGSGGGIGNPPVTTAAPMGDSGWRRGGFSRSYIQGGNQAPVVINFNKKPPSEGTIRAARDFAQNYKDFGADIGILGNEGFTSDQRGTALYRLKNLQKAAGYLNDQDNPLDNADRASVDEAIANAGYSGIQSVNPRIAAARQLKAAQGAKIQPVNELKMANANAAQDYLAANSKDVPDILMKLADSIAGVGKVSEETVKKAQDYVKGFKDSGDQLEQAIKTKEAGGNLTPSQSRLLGGGSLDEAKQRLSEQRATASYMQGSLYSLGMGMGEIGEEPPSLGGRIAGGIENAYNRIIKGTGLFHARLAVGMFVNPAIREAQQYQEYQAGIGQNLYQSGQVNFEQLMQGSFGTVSRREAMQQQASLAYGQQVLSAYSPFVNAFINPQMAQSPLGAAAAIGGPALGIGIAASSLINPIFGSLAAVATAGVGVSGYIQSAANPTDIRAKMALGQQALGQQSTFQGQVGYAANATGLGGGQIGNSPLAQIAGALGGLGGPFSALGALARNPTLNPELMATSPIVQMSTLARAVQAYRSGTPIQQIQQQFPNINIGDVVQGNMDQTIQGMGQPYGMTDTQAQAALAPYMYYSQGGALPTTPQIQGLVSNYQAGNVLPQTTSTMLANLGLSPSSPRAMSIMSRASTWLNKQPNQIQANDALGQATQMTNQANLLAQQAGLPQINPEYATTMFNAYGAARPIAIAQQIANSAEVKLTNPQYYASQAMQSTFAPITNLVSSGQYGLAGQAEQQRLAGGDLYNRIINLGGNVAQANAAAAGFNQAGYGTAAQAQFAQQLASGDRMSISLLGQRTGNQWMQTVNPQTGMDIGFQNIPAAFQQFARGNDPYRQFAGVTPTELASGTRGMSQEIFSLQRNQQALEYGIRTQQRDVGYNMQVGNLSQVSQLYGQAGMGFNAGNGMGYWQLEDANRLLNRTQQRFAYGQETQQLGIQEAQYTLQGNQFYQQFGLQQRKFQYDTSYQRQQMQIDQSHVQQQQGWQTEDLAYSRNLLDINFGWQQEDYTRNIRYARGREKRDLMREQQRSTVMYAMQAGHSDELAGRNQTQIQWEQQDFERRKQYFEQQTQFQKESMDQQKQFFEQGRELDRQRLDLQEAAHNKQLLWMNEQFKLEDQRVLLDRQNYQYQYRQQVLLDTTSQNTTIHVQNLSNAINGLNSFIDTLIAKIGTATGQTDIQVANGASIGSGVVSTPGAGPGGLPAVTGTRATNGKSGNAIVAGFGAGGYTGIGHPSVPAGIVHKGEYVVPQEGAMVVRGQDDEARKKQDDMIRLLEQSVKLQQALVQKNVSFTAIVNGKAASPVSIDLGQQARSRL